MSEHRLDSLIRPHLSRLVEIRKDLHRHPELAYGEHRTSGVIQSLLSELGLSFRSAAETGVISDMGTGSKTIALRADMDALPLEERNTFEHRSQAPGVMHACGHDGHTTILLGTALALHASLPHDAGRVRLLFQPAEEGGAGAKRLIDAGALDSVETIFGLHNWPANDLGTVGIKTGPLMASSSLIEIEIQGRGGHGSQPHNTKDPIVAAAHLVAGLQTLVSRECDPREAAVVSICTIHGGTAKNVIPDSVSIAGTIRTLDDTRADWLGQRIGEIASAVVGGFGCQAETRYERQYPALVNHPTEALLVEDIARETLGHSAPTTDGLPVMGAEDFSFYLRDRPGAFFFLGAARPGEPTPLIHQSDYDFNDDLLLSGIRIFLRIIERQLDVELAPPTT